MLKMREPSTLVNRFVYHLPVPRGPRRSRKSAAYRRSLGLAFALSRWSVGFSVRMSEAFESSMDDMSMMEWTFADY